MLELTVSWWELIVRAAAIYVVVVLLLRLTGKRQVGQFTPFDLAVLLLVSEAVSNALSAGDNSLIAASIAAATLLILNAAVGWITARSRRAENVMEGRPRFLIKEGRVDYKVMREESITPRELLAALRGEGCFTPKQVEYAVLETSGSISVRRKGQR